MEVSRGRSGIRGLGDGWRRKSYELTVDRLFAVREPVFWTVGLSRSLGFEGVGEGAFYRPGYRNECCAPSRSSRSSPTDLAALTLSRFGAVDERVLAGGGHLRCSVAEGTHLARLILKRARRAPDPATARGCEQCRIVG